MSLPAHEREIIVVRSLTDSDMGLFAAHRSSATSKQRAININAPIAQKILSPAVMKAGGCNVECFSDFDGIKDRSERYFGRVGKNWRLGGNKLEGQEFALLDSKDFMLLRTVELNDGSSPVYMSFVSRAVTPTDHATIVAIVLNNLNKSMAVFPEGHGSFKALAAFISKPEIVQAQKTAVKKFTVAPMPVDEPRSREAKTRSVREKLRSPHILEQMLKVAGDLSAPAQLRFMDTVEQLASQLRQILIETGRIVRITKDHTTTWKSVTGKLMGFVDGGLANLTMLGSAPIAARVGGYIVTPGDRTEARERFTMLKTLIDDLFVHPEGGVYDNSFPDIGALRDAARISIEAAGAVKSLTEFQKLSWLFLHGSLVNPVSRYTDVMFEGKVRHRFPNFSGSALEVMLPPEDRNREGRDANFVSVYLRQLDIMRSAGAIVCGVVERASTTSSVCEAVLNSLDNFEIKDFLPKPPDEWKRWFHHSLNPAESEDTEGQRITDSLLFRCVLEPGEALVPVELNRNDLRRAPEAWKDVIREYPKPWVSYLQPTEWSAPIRIEVFEKDKENFLPTATLVMHSALLLPHYAFPVGLDIVDKYAHIPNWMSRPVHTFTAVRALRAALESKDEKLFDSLRRLLCGSSREWLFRPKI